MLRAADAACDSALDASSSEYANPLFSPLTARTPTPCSMLWLPCFTMPSSSTQPSDRVDWK